MPFGEGIGDEHDMHLDDMDRTDEIVREKRKAAIDAAKNDRANDPMAGEHVQMPGEPDNGVEAD